jgi:hypothetical protein
MREKHFDIVAKYLSKVTRKLSNEIDYFVNEVIWSDRLDILKLLVGFEFITPEKYGSQDIIEYLASMGGK